MLNGMLGRKIGMTQIFDEKGTVTQVTVVQVNPGTVIQKKTQEIDGYESVQVGFEPIEKRKVNRPAMGHFKNQKPMKFLKEFKADDMDQIEVGQVIDLNIFQEGEKVAVTGTSKGKGFTGVVKKYGFAGFPASHGHRGNRVTGSIGQCATPAKVFKGKKMPGQHGNKNVTTLGLTIEKIIPEDQLILIKGAIPGKNGGIVTLKKSTR